MGVPEEFLEGFASSGNASGFVEGALESGWSMSASLDFFRESGGSIADYRFSELWDQISEGTLPGLPTEPMAWFSLPDESSIEAFETRSARGFLYQFDVIEQIFGTSQFTTTQMSVRSDYLISPNEAFARLADYYTFREPGRGTPQNLLVGPADLTVFSLTPAGR